MNARTELGVDDRELPPLEAYAQDSPGARRSNGAGDAHETASSNPFKLRSAAQIAAQPQTALWLIKGVLERNALLLMFGELGSLKSFLALDWALQTADGGEQVIYLHAEGRGLWKRLRAWAMHRYPNTSWQQTLDRLPFHALERPINLSADVVVAQLCEAIEQLGDKKPVLIIVDTMGRNSDGTVERSTEDAQVYLNRLDNGLRAVYGCSVLFVTHVGHAVKDRARGPYALMANTDANYSVERPDPLKLEIIVKVGRMKDAESPPPMAYVADVIELDVFEDGAPMTSLALRATERPAVATRRREPTGKHQTAMLSALQEHFRTAPTDLLSSLEWRAIGKAQGVPRQRFKEVEDALVKFGWIVPSVGGWRYLRDPE